MIIIIIMIVMIVMVVVSVGRPAARAEAWVDTRADNGWIYAEDLTSVQAPSDLVRLGSR